MKSAASTPYLVRLADRAAFDLEALFIEKNAAESHAAARWYNELEDSIYALDTYRERCPIIPEARRLRRRLRHLLYGKKPHIYRVIYEIDDAHKTVLVIHIRHGAQRKLKAADLE